ncbi:hypothetical protein E2562_030141 [Oryza meyeriana var. granulata]|uniref:Uncharacterized protein n=1 Tax=Oryza meyeriana var. granulata TaxID=110450 RepID=A0A6G1BNY3_9ORYZ|nr:hypothetical protein E2562_030141 [Oryza meyeriana var. granulata]
MEIKKQEKIAAARSSPLRSAGERATKKKIKKQQKIAAVCASLQCGQRSDEGNQETCGGEDNRAA